MTLQPFDYDGQQVRAIDRGGAPWFVAADAAVILGYSATSALTRTLDEDEKGVHTLHTPGGDQQVTVISEPGLYSAILRSRVPGAKAFKRWITHEVIPAIRKTGGYGVQQLTGPELMAMAVLEAAETIKARDEKIAELEAPARAWRHMVDTDGTLSVGDAAKALATDPEIEIGRTRLFAYLQEIGWIYRTGQRDRESWSAYQTQIETGRLVEKLNRPFLNAKTGEYEAAGVTIRITAKGLDELHRRLTGKNLRLVTA